VTRRELLARIATFPLVTDELADDLLSGDFRSVFRGQGIEFDEVRHYELGDDVRSIDWNVSARFGSPYVKMFREERELTVFVILDSTASMDSGGGTLSRREQAVLALALLVLSAERAGERVGALIYDGDARRFFSPKKGRSHAMAIVEAAVSSSASARGASLARSLGRALAGSARVLKRRSLVAVVSDFLCSEWERDLGRLSRKHDVVAFRVSDPVDAAMPDAGLVLMRDPETGIELRAPTGFASFRDAWSYSHRERAEAWRAACSRHGVPAVELSTDDDAVVVLSRFFGARRRA
jgi:uncharacterized protein (DUF58 family)